MSISRFEFIVILLLAVLGTVNLAFKFLSPSFWAWHWVMLPFVIITAYLLGKWYARYRHIKKLRR